MHCKRELIHAIFNLVLNDRFLDAYHHRFVVKCSNRQCHRLCPCIVMYSADYPEKCAHSIPVLAEETNPVIQGLTQYDKI